MRVALPRFSRLFLALACCGLAACANFPTDAPPHLPVRMESGPEAEARAALVNVMSVAKRQDPAEFKALLAAADLADFEALERDHPGMLRRMMGSLSTAKPKDFDLDLNGTLATFTRKTRLDGSDPTAMEAATVTLVQEGSQWKLGKPSPIASSRDAATEQREHPPAPSAPRKNKSHGKVKPRRT